MRVGDVTTREVVTLKVDETLDLASDIMRLGRIRHMPVVDGEQVAGVLSQRDLFRAALSSVLQVDPSTERKWLASVRVREVMSSPAIVVTPGTSLREALSMMLDRRIGCLPVVEDGRLVGLLSETDCLRHLARVLDIDQQRHDLPGMEEPE